MSDGKDWEGDMDDFAEEGCLGGIISAGRTWVPIAGHFPCWGGIYATHTTLNLALDSIVECIGGPGS